MTLVVCVQVPAFAIAGALHTGSAPCDCLERLRSCRGSRARQAESCGTPSSCAGLTDTVCRQLAARCALAVDLATVYRD